MVKPTFATLLLLLAVIACTKQTPAPSPVPTLAPTYTPAPTVTRTPPPLPTSAPRYVVVYGNWNCREFAIQGAPILYQIKDGTVVEIIQQHEGWTQVKIADDAAPCWIVAY